MSILQAATIPIQIIGLDCDDPLAVHKLLQHTPDILKKADIICGASSILAQFQQEPELRGRLLKIATPFESVLDSIFDLSQQGLRIVVLADGDPLFFGIGTSLVRRAPKQPVVITPAVSTLQAACSRLKIPWHNVFCMALHGRENLAPLYHAVSAGHTICILTGSSSPPDALARLLIDRGVDWFDAHIYERMGHTDEISLTLSLKDCAKGHFGPYSTLLLVPRQKPRAPSVGLEKTRFRGTYPYSRGIRGTILEFLKILPGNTIWDIGAASGILSLECCVLAHEGRVIALENNIGLCLDIQNNRRLLGAINLDIIPLMKPNILSDIPQPDKIFINAFTPISQAIIEKCVWALPRNGRLAMASPNLDRFYKLQTYMMSLNWPVETMQIQIADSISPNKEPLKEMPVYILASQKP